MNTAQLFAIILLSIVIVIQASVVLYNYYEKNNPKYLKIYNFLKKISTDLDNGSLITLTDIRYELMRKFNLTNSESITCMQHMYDTDETWFKNNIL